MKYYFYLITSLGGRAGFGITSIPHERNKQYCSHSGGIVKFTHLYEGQRTHAKALERTIKTQYIDNLWVIDDWKTEWLNDNIPMSELKNYVESLIAERHFKIKEIAQDFTFQSELLEQ